MRAATRWMVGLGAVGVALAPATVALGVPVSTAEVRMMPSVAAKAQLPRSVSPHITAAAWYQPDPLCSTPLGCGAIKLPPLSPYPKGTYHVAVAVGRQTARAFLAVRLGAAAQQARGGRLSIPLDTSATDGSIAPQAAQINVCVTYQAVTDVEGGFDGAPSANCLPAAHATYVAHPAPHLVANLNRLGGKLAGVKGFALVPAEAAPTSAWSVVFRLPTGKATASSLPRLTLLTGAPHHASTSAAAHHRGAATGPAGLGGGAVGPLPTLPPAVSVVQPSNAAPVVASTTRAGRFVTVGYQYPEVWLLPLVLIVLVPFMLRALTKDLTRRR